MIPLLALSACTTQRNLSFSTKSSTLKVETNGCSIKGIKLKNLTGKPLSSKFLTMYKYNPKTNVTSGSYSVSCDATTPHGTTECRYYNSSGRGGNFDVFGGLGCPDIAYRFQ